MLSSPLLYVFKKIDIGIVAALQFNKAIVECRNQVTEMLLDIIVYWAFKFLFPPVWKITIIVITMLQLISYVLLGYLPMIRFRTDLYFLSWSITFRKQFHIVDYWLNCKAYHSLLLKINFFQTYFLFILLAGHTFSQCYGV